MTRSTPDTDPLGAAIRAAAGEIRAPEALRARVADQRAAAPRGVPLALLAGALAVVACAAALVLVVGLFGGSNTIEGPTLARAADAALGTAKGPPPVVVPSPLRAKGPVLQPDSTASATSRIRSPLMRTA